MRSVKHKAGQSTPVVQEIMRCLQVNTSEAYLETVKRLNKLTDEQQTGKDRFSMLIFNIHDDTGDRFAKGRVRCISPGRQQVSAPMPTQRVLPGFAR